MPEVLICVNRSLRGDLPSCAGRGSVAIAEAIERGIAERGLGHVKLDRIRCFGQCARGPNLRVVGGAFRNEVALADVPAILDWLAGLPATDGAAAAGAVPDPGGAPDLGGPSAPGS